MYLDYGASDYYMNIFAFSLIACVLMIQTYVCYVYTDGFSFNLPMETAGA